MASVAVDTRDVLPLLKALQGVSKELRLNANRRLRAAAGDCARGLIVELRGAAASSDTPQARLVAASLRVKNDRVPAVTVGGNRRVGHRRTPAGLLVWGSERGGRTFAAPTSYAGYWISPTVDAYARGPAVRVYQGAVAAILKDAGVL